MTQEQIEQDERNESVHWEPLETIAKYDLRINLGEWMYMGSYSLDKHYCIIEGKGAVTVHTYKHCDTRRYLNLTDDLRCWQYNSQANMYTALPREAAIQHALS